MIDRSMSTSYVPAGRGYRPPGAACAIAEVASATLMRSRQYNGRAGRRWLIGSPVGRGRETWRVWRVEDRRIQKHGEECAGL